MRGIAERLKDPEAKAKMLRVAADYENIAQTAIGRAAGSRPLDKEEAAEARIQVRPRPTDPQQG
jgi:hypothetical protein